MEVLTSNVLFLVGDEVNDRLRGRLGYPCIFKVGGLAGSRGKFHPTIRRLSLWRRAQIDQAKVLEAWVDFGLFACEWLRERRSLIKPIRVDGINI